MPADPSVSSDPGQRLQEIKPSNLWFGFAGSVFAWIVLGCADIVIAWRACMHQWDFGVPPVHPGIGLLISLVTLLLLAITGWAGYASYRNWKWLSQQRKMLDSQAVPRGEFMALSGVIVAFTLGLGMVWLALPPLFIELCWRAR